MQVDSIPSVQNVVTPENSESDSLVGTPEVSAGLGTVGFNKDADATLGNSIPVEADSSSSVSSGAARRSIFCSYWKDKDQNTHDGATSRQGQTVGRSKSPRCVLRHPHVQVYARPDQFCEKHEETKDVEVSYYSSTGSKRKEPSSQKENRAKVTSSPYDSLPLSFSSIWKSLPAIFLEERSKVLPRQIKSDPSLSSKQLKPTLRKGRFSGGSTSRDERCKAASVKFRPLIKVHPFDPPMDCWAESGWSKQFGS